jgi:hypothetical protein
MRPFEVIVRHTRPLAKETKRARFLGESPVGNESVTFRNQSTPLLKSAPVCVSTVYSQPDGSTRRRQCRSSTAQLLWAIIARLAVTRGFPLVTGSPPATHSSPTLA